MNPVNYYTRAFQNYVNFSGRDSRKQYWMFVLGNIIVSFVLGIIGSILGKDVSNIISFIYSLAILLPSTGMAVRRLHDIGKSGWFFLVVLIPLVGAFILIFFLIKEGDPAPNEYGDPVVED